MKRNLILIGIGAIAIISLSMNFLNTSSKNKIAFFDYNKVYNDCTLKKDLEKDLEKVVSARKSDLDSMQLELTFLSNKIKAGNTDQNELDAFENLKNRYLTFQNQYEQENIRLKEEYFTQIRTKINESAREYAEEQGYDYFFSAMGDGSLMYANDSDDATKEFLKFIDK